MKANPEVAQEIETTIKTNAVKLYGDDLQWSTTSNGAVVPFHKKSNDLSDILNSYISVDTDTDTPIEIDIDVSPVEEETASEVIDMKNEDATVEVPTGEDEADDENKRNWWDHDPEDWETAGTEKDDRDWAFSRIW
jgi:hypothetical protein